MNRALSFFVLFCLLLACLGGLIAWWLGPHLVSLAFDSQRADAPFYALYLQHQSGPQEGTNSQEESQENGYNVRLLQLLAHPVEPTLESSPMPEANSDVISEPPASILWQTSLLSVLAGSVADEWSNLVVARFATGREFVRLVTSSQYRQVRDQAPRGKRVVVGSSLAPLRSLQHPAALLLLVEGDARQALDEWLVGLALLGGEVIWDAPVTVLEPAGAQAADWDALVLVGFADAQTLEAWSFSVEAQTATALLSAKTKSANLWLLQSLH